MIIYQLNGFCVADIDFISKLDVMDFAIERLKDLPFIKSDQDKFSCKPKVVNSHLIHKEWIIMGGAVQDNIET